MDGTRPTDDEHEGPSFSRTDALNELHALSDRWSGMAATGAVGNAMLQVSPRDLLPPSRAAADASPSSELRWEAELQLRFPTGYAVHPRTWDALDLLLAGRSAVMADANEQLLIIFTGTGAETLDVVRDVRAVGGALLGLLGLGFQHVVETTVRHVSSPTEVLARLDDLVGSDADVVPLHKAR